jgi:hypothetical protein
MISFRISPFIIDPQSDETSSGAVQIILIFVRDNVPHDDADENGHSVCIQDLRGFHTAQDTYN